MKGETKQKSRESELTRIPCVASFQFWWFIDSSDNDDYDNFRQEQSFKQGTIVREY